MEKTNNYSLVGVWSDEVRKAVDYISNRCSSGISGFPLLFPPPPRFFIIIFSGAMIVSVILLFLLLLYIILHSNSILLACES